MATTRKKRELQVKYLYTKFSGENLVADNLPIFVLRACTDVSMAIGAKRRDFFRRGGKDSSFLTVEEKLLYIQKNQLPPATPDRVDLQKE